MVHYNQYHPDDEINDKLYEEGLTAERDIVDQTRTDLIDSMVVGYLQDIETYFDLDTTNQAIIMIKESLKRIEAENE